MWIWTAIIDNDKPWLQMHMDIDPIFAEPNGPKRTNQAEHKLSITTNIYFIRLICTGKGARIKLVN